MTKEELANLLNGRQYRNEITEEECKLAKDNNLVVVFGCSDDLAELRGAIRGEILVDIYSSFSLCKDGVFPTKEEIEEGICTHKIDRYYKYESKKIDTIWGKNTGYSWTYKTDIPHTTFDIVEDGEKYCRGIVFSLEDLPGLISSDAEKKMEKLLGMSRQLDDFKKNSSCTREDSLNELTQSLNLSMYRHKKGGLYTVLTEATHTETKEEMVIYHDAEGNMFARPKAMFFDGRFELVNK